MDEIPTVCEFLIVSCAVAFTFFFSFLFFLFLTANAESVRTFEENLSKYLKCQYWNLKTTPLYQASLCFISGKSVVCGHLMEAAP